MPIFAAPIPTGVICWAGSVGGLSLEIGSVLEFALVLTGSGMTGIGTGVGIGYKALGTEMVGLMVGTFTSTGDVMGGDTRSGGSIVTGDGIGVTLGLGVGKTIAVGWLFFPQAVTINIASKHRLR